MKNLLYFLISSSIILTSCSSTEEEKEETKKVNISKKDSVSTDSSEAEIKTVPRLRLPKHAGSWIDDNLDNSVFFSEKVDLMVQKSSAKFIPPQEAVMDYNFDFINAKEIKKLNTRELIYYALAYPASFSQVCAEGFYDSTANIPKINGYIPFSYEAEEMSDIQWSEINSRRDSVILVITNYMKENSDRIDYDYLRLLERLDAIEAFPVVMATASKENLANYSFLLQFMHTNEFAPLRVTDFYDKMYGENSYYNNNSVEATPKLKKAIIKLATAFYKDWNEE